MENIEKELRIDELVKNGVTNITVLEGKALTPREKQTHAFTGNIKAPGNYVKVRNNKPENGIVIFSRDEMYIEYIEDQFDQLTSTVKGSLTLNPDLKKFGINQQKEYSTKDFASFINMRKHLFDNKDHAQEIVVAFNKFSAKISTQLDQHQDNSGNKRQLLDRTVDSDAPKSMKLKMPLFVGYDDNTFSVEICFSTTDASIKIWLESPELEELIQTTKNGIIDEELKNFEGLVIIEK